MSESTPTQSFDSFAPSGSGGRGIFAATGGAPNLTTTTPRRPAGAGPPSVWLEDSDVGVTASLMSPMQRDDRPAPSSAFSMPSPAPMAQPPMTSPIPLVGLVRDQWSCWVVVFGLAGGEAEDVAVQTVRAFMAFGQVVESHLGAGNFMFLKYASPLQASKAVTQNPTPLSTTVLVGVTALTADLASRLGFVLNHNDGSVTVIGGARASLTDAQNTARMEGIGRQDGLPRRPYIVDESEILRTPKRHVNICRRIMQFLFSW